jgi:hypothetical protein
MTGDIYVDEAITRTSDTVLTCTIKKQDWSTATDSTLKLKVFDGQEAELYGTAGGWFQACVAANVLDVASDSGTVSYQ